MERKITATARLVYSNPNMDDMPAGSTHWRVTLRYCGRRMTVPFSMGPAHCAEPTASDVLYCLCADASGVENARGFEDWCAEYGYDSDSRKAERMFRACERHTAKLRRFLGDDFSSLVFADEDELARHCA